MWQCLKCWRSIERSLLSVDNSDLPIDFNCGWEYIWISMNYTDLTFYIVGFIGFVASIIEIYSFLCKKDIHIHISFFAWIPYIYISIAGKSQARIHKEGFRLFLKKVYQKRHDGFVNAAKLARF